MPNDATPIPSISTAAEAATRTALDYVARIGGVAPVLLAFANEPLAWDGLALTAPAGPHGRLQVALDRNTSPVPGLVVMLHLPPLELYSGTILIPAPILAAGG
jgi:hypothetical protein